MAALIQGRRLTLIDVARAWPGAERIRAPLKALDRLLGNRHLHAEREHLHEAMARWLLRGPHSVIVLDWCDLKADRRWHLLRAAVPVGGRMLIILDMVSPDGQQDSPAAEKRFLHRLATLIPEGMQPILVTDAGFRAPWLTGCAVEKRFARSKRWVGTGLAVCAIARWSSLRIQQKRRIRGSRAARSMSWRMPNRATWACADGRVLVGGDGCLGPCVECAFLSGRAVARTCIERWFF